MPVYTYTGINDKGKKVAGTIDAENEKAARAKLRKASVFPTSLGVGGTIRTAGAGLTSHIDLGRYLKRVSLQDISLMTRQLATLLSANIPLVDALQAIYEQVANEKLRAVTAQMRERVMEGSRLSDAMRAHPKIFNEMYVNMVSAGENSGALDIVLSRLADFIESQHRIRSRVTGAMIYPVIMGVVGVILMGVLLTFMVPKMTAIFKGQNMVLPLPTQILIFVSELFSSYWYLILAIFVLGGFYLRRWFRTPKGREYRDRKVLRVPLFGNLVRMVSISRFARTLATLLASGVPMLMAMDIVSNVVGNLTLRKVIEETRTSVKEGESIAEPLRRSGEFPPIVTHMIAIGEKTGGLEKMLERVSDTYDSQVETSISTMLSLLEPVLILVMGGAITFVVMSILLPILQMGDLGALR